MKLEFKDTGIDRKNPDRARASSLEKRWTPNLDAEAERLFFLTNRPKNG
jgi:hypothetical protein